MICLAHIGNSEKYRLGSIIQIETKPRYAPTLAQTENTRVPLKREEHADSLGVSRETPGADEAIQHEGSGLQQQTTKTPGVAALKPTSAQWTLWHPTSNPRNCGPRQ